MTEKTERNKRRPILAVYLAIFVACVAAAALQAIPHARPSGIALAIEEELED